MGITEERELVSFANGLLYREVGAGSPGRLILRSHVQILGIHIR